MMSQVFTQEDASLRSGAPIAIALFGPLTVTIQGKVVTQFRSNKTRALLAYLVLTHPWPAQRTALCELLWPGATEQTALTNLRQTLANLRECLAPVDLIASTRTQISLRTEPGAFWCDVHGFERLLAACHEHAHERLSHCPLCRDRLQEAVALYTAPLLKPFPDIDSAPFLGWLKAHRERLASELAEAQATLTAGQPKLGNLPLPLTPLVGRTVELGRLERNLQHTIYRCTSLVGPGGIGKTRLACALAARLQSQFPDGVWLIELSGVAPSTPDEAPAQVADRVAIAIAQTLGLAFHGTTPPATQVANFLSTKAALLILDSFEHLLAAAPWLSTLLTAAAQVHLLITTRHRLPLPDQLVYAVEGLGVPPALPADYVADHWLAQYASLQLFVERADSAGLRVPRDHATLTTIGELCQLVDGSPWAIELAVGLLDRQSPADILAAIQANYRVLTSHLLDVPPRQRSAAAVFRTTWDLLTPDEAQTLARCAVFRGGFTLTMAQTIAATTATVIEALVYKSLLHPSGVDRYTMHDLVRQFAEEQLAQDATGDRACRTAHAAYFTALLATWQPTDAVIQPFRRAVAQDWENVQAAWTWALAAGEVSLLQQGVGGLAEFGELLGFCLETERILGTALDRVRELLAVNQATAPVARTDEIALSTLLAHLLWRRSHFRIAALGQLEGAHALAEELLRWGEQLADDTLIAWGYCELSLVALYQGDYQRQEALLLLALPRAQERDDRYAQVFYLMLLGTAKKLQYDYAAAHYHFETALTLVQPLQYSVLELRVLQNLGSSHWSAGNFTEAHQYLQQGLMRAQQIDQKDAVAFATACLGALAYTLGDYATARTHVEMAHQLYVEFGDQVMAARMLNIIAALLIDLGDLALAGEYCQRALALPSVQTYAVQWEGMLMQGHLHRAARNWSAAHAAYEAAYTLSQQSNQLADLLTIQAYLANLHLVQGEATTALITVEPVLANFAVTDFAPAQRPQELLLIAYEILMANHDPRAQAVVAQAWAVVQEQADKIDDPHLRQSFLTNVPVNHTLGTLMASGVYGVEV